MSGLSALYAGDVVHQRFKPKRHRLRYRVFCLLLDLDELEALGRRLTLFGYNRWSVFSFQDRDHGVGEVGGLKRWVAGHLEAAGLSSDGLSVQMLCYPRMFGYVFNPLTVYFCHARDGRLNAILYEVCNTFHERHTYVIPVAGQNGTTVRHACAKEMYVSPFVPMNCTYRFRILPPQDTVMIAINEADPEGALLYASFAGRRRPLSDAGLVRALISYPLMTLKVMGAIHWEALKLWWKGVPIHRHSKAASPVASSIIQPESTTARTPS